VIRLADIKLVSFREPSFVYNKVIGNVGKELVHILLEACRYSVYPLGYGSYLTHVKDLYIHRSLRSFQ